MDDDISFADFPLAQQFSFGQNTADAFIFSVVVFIFTDYE